MVAILRLVLQVALAWGKAWLISHLKRRTIRAPAPPAIAFGPPPLCWWTEEKLRRVRFFEEHYRAAARKSGVPWRLLATVHKVERKMSDKPVTGGWCQLDRGASSPEAGRVARERYVARVMREYGIREWGPLRSDARTGALVCAYVLMRKVPTRLKGVNHPWNEEKASEALFGYNGRSKYYCERWQTGKGSKKRSWRWSPYVSNFVDGRQLFVKGRQYHKGKRVTIPRKKYRAPGALLVWRELKAHT